MPVTIALAGNPNSGKTTMFNDLTGSTQRVGNWPGVTVEKKGGTLKSNKDIVIQDLPGIYSLSPYTLEEVVSRNYLINEAPHAILNIIDASNIERNLYLTTQLAEIGVPMVLALNMIDMVNKNGDSINVDTLSQMIGCPVVETSAIKGQGSRQAVELAVEQAKKAAGFSPAHRFSAEIEAVLAQIEELIAGRVAQVNSRWYAIKLFERDKEVLSSTTLDTQILEKIEEITARAEEAMDDEAESIITTERYAYIDKVVSACVVHKNRGALSSSDKIDQIVTNRILALPIFALVMWLVYYISISTIGGMATDFVNEGVFGDGFFLFGNGREPYDQAVYAFEAEQAKIDAFLEAAEESGLDVAAMQELLDAEEPDEAYAQSVTDAFVLRAAAENVLAEAVIEDEDGEVVETFEVTAVSFQNALQAEEPDAAEYGSWVRSVPVFFEEWMSSGDTSEVMMSLAIDGIIGGVGAVLGFLPQMLVLFLCLSILEDCGYMARIAFILDRVFRKFGLSGKSFIPMLISTGCAVPGIMASRTIENDKDRRMTVITTTFMPCGAKLPIIALIAGALFPDSSWVGPSTYFIGIAAILVSGIMLKKTKVFSGDPAPFIMELPAYHAPGVGSVLRTTGQRGWAFVKKASSIVLLSTISIWFLSSFNGSLEMVDTSESLLAAMGGFLAPLFAPLGWGFWECAVASITGLIAKENVVGTLGVLFGFAEVAENGAEYWVNLQTLFTPLSGFSFLLFNLLCAPCFAAIGAVRREMMSGKWTAFAIAYQCAFAYGVAFCVYQIGRTATGGGFGLGTAAALAVVAVVVYMLARKPRSGNAVQAPASTSQKAVR